MRIAVIGGGPGGLYFAYLWKKRHPDAGIDLFEQNAAGATWGFGVVFSEQALEFLRADDPDTVDAIAPRMESWQNITLNLRGENVAIDGVGFSSSFLPNPRSVSMNTALSSLTKNMSSLLVKFPTLSSCLGMCTPS